MQLQLDDAQVNVLREAISFYIQLSSGIARGLKNGIEEAPDEMKDDLKSLLNKGRRQIRNAKAIREQLGGAPEPNESTDEADAEQPRAAASVNTQNLAGVA